jgi:hypothetical protein
MAAAGVSWNLSESMWQSAQERRVGGTRSHVAGIGGAFVGVVERDGGVNDDAGDQIARIRRAGVVVTEDGTGETQVNFGRWEVFVAPLDVKMKRVRGHDAACDGKRIGRPIAFVGIVIVRGFSAQPALLEHVQLPAGAEVTVAPVDTDRGGAASAAEAQLCPAFRRGARGHRDLGGNGKGEGTPDEADISVSPALGPVIALRVQRNSGAG